MLDKKISIAIAQYNNEKYLKHCLNSLINQSYKNLEIIVVNDGSLGNCDEIMEEYLNKDKRFKYIKHTTNKGLFQARLTGANAATGDYIAFLDADDYVSVDFYRSLLRNAVENDSDIVIGKIIMEHDDGTQEFYNLFETNFEKLEGKDCLKEYFRQEGLNFSWHTGCNQLYSIKLWEKAKKHFDKITKHLIMTEDFAFSTVLFYYANRVTKINNDCLFYCKHDVTSTTVNDINYKKQVKNLKDLITSFNFVEQFLKEKKIYGEYKNNFSNWKNLYANMHKKYIDETSSISPEEKKKLYCLLNEYCHNITEVRNADLFSSVITSWNNGLNELKQKILNPNVLYVSFDIFDTLISRPFFSPSDLFKIMDKEYRKYEKTGVNFSKMRIEAEYIAREKQYNIDKKIQEITLDDIYKTIEEYYDIDRKILNILKKHEIELELRFCKKRQTGYELYQLALDIGKKVICISDMYLNENDVKKILKNNGYDNVFKLYLSSSIKKTKSTGNLYDYVLKDINIESNQLLHIGDNYNSDFIVAKQKEINVGRLPRAIDVMLDRGITGNLSKMLTENIPFWMDTAASMEFMGVRTFLAIVANKYFDNPYRPFNCDSVFNGDPYLIGYYAMGMYIFSISKWLLDNCTNVNDKISFMARDGYLVQQAYKLMQHLYPNSPKAEYLYCSRKAMIPVMIDSKLDFYRLSEIFDLESQTPKGIIKYLEPVLKINIEKLKKICNNNLIDFSRPFKNVINFNKFIKIILDNFYDEKYMLDNRKKLKTYFENIIGDNSAIFDVGYSARPEFYISHLCEEKNIDTYFLNINCDLAFDYEKLGKIKLHTYFPAKPTLTGNAYELLMSKQSPSCIGYDFSIDSIEPVFEKYKNIYQVEYIVETIQKACLLFIKDVVDIFGQDIDVLYYQNYYMNLPILAFFNSSEEIDMKCLSAVEFEDDIRKGISKKMVEEMRKEAYNKRQFSMDVLTTNNVIMYNTKSSKLNYNRLVKLDDKNKLTRFIYYILFDKETAVRRMKDSLKKIVRK